jgi:hypothetical protein
MSGLAAATSVPVVHVPADMRFDDDSNVDGLNEQLNNRSIAGMDLVEEFLASQQPPSHPAYHPHPGRQILALQDTHESKYDRRVLEKKGEVDAFRDTNVKINHFLDVLGGELSNTSSSIIDLSSHKELRQELAAKFPHKFLDKDKLTRDEAQALERAFGRHMQELAQQINHTITALTNLASDKNEFVKIFQQLLEMLQRHQETIVRNQRAG